MRYFLLLISISSLLVAHEPIHSSLNTYFESIDFKNSTQKTGGNLVGVGGDVHIENSEFRFAYEYANTQTKQPPLKDDLTTQKVFLKYAYEFENALSVHLNYGNVLKDNIAPTKGGKLYGAGVGYDANKKIYLNFTQFYSDYKEFNVHQSDLKIDYKTKIEKLKLKFTLLAHAIKLDDHKSNSFSRNADESYFSTALKLHAHYESYHLGAAAYFGKRVFAVMNDGFKLQHHAMEFDRTYALGIGKTFADFTLRVQGIYQRATELPQNNENVKVVNLRLIANYGF